MTGKNQFGLSRYIPADVTRQVRRECGFGCVICGLAIVQYEHIDPAFADATVHDPAKIALLCAACHDHVTRGQWSKQRVIDARRQPVTFTKGYSHDAFDINHPFTLQVGSNLFHDVRSIIREPGRGDWFTIEPPEGNAAPARISATFFDAAGTPSLSIERNEWTCPTAVWDMKIEGRIIEVRHTKSELGLRLRASPPHHLAIERLNMRRGDIRLDINETGLVVLNYGERTRIEMAGDKAVGAEAIYTIPKAEEL